MKVLNLSFKNIVTLLNKGIEKTQKKVYFSASFNALYLHTPEKSVTHTHTHTHTHIRTVDQIIL